MVRSVSWWICTALAKACWSRPLLWPEVWLPSALSLQIIAENYIKIHTIWLSFKIIVLIQLTHYKHSHRKHVPVMLLVYQVIASPEGHQMGVVGWCWDGHWPSAADIGVTELVGENLQFIWREVVVIPEHVVVRWSAGSLQKRKKRHKSQCISAELQFCPIVQKTAITFMVPFTLSLNTSTMM